MVRYTIVVKKQLQLIGEKFQKCSIMFVNVKLLTNLNLNLKKVIMVPMVNC
jgi:hypothetical protein